MSRPRSIELYEDTINHTDPPVHQQNDFELLQNRPTFTNKAKKMQASVNIDMKDDYTDTEDSSLWVEDSNIDLEESESLELQMLNQSEASNESLFPLLYKKDYEAFVAKANTYNVHYCDNRRHTYLQYACKFGLVYIVKVLLDLEVDPNKTVRGGRRTPIMIAAYNGHFDIVKMLADTKKIIYKISDEGDNILHVLIIGALVREHKSEAIDTSRALENTDFYQCLEYLLNNVPKNQLDINLLNRRYKTVLHYAISADNRDLIGLLLKHGAYIGVASAQAEMPIKFMKAATLQYFIDKSISMKRHTGRTMRKYPWIGLDYNLLACKNFSASVLETKPLVVISEVTHLRPLLKHPYFDAFLELKWNIMMKKLTLVNYFFYSIYVLFRSSFLLVTYAPMTTELASKNNTSPNNSVINYTENLRDIILWYIVVLLNSVLFSREFLQFIIYSTSNKYRYIKNFVNWIELPLIIFTYIILFVKIDSVRNRSLLTVSAIFLSWLELMLLILSHPSRSVHILMFKAVAWNSLKFLLCYVILIVAFALSFYLLLKDTSPEFKNIILAVFKTWVMSVGEYQVSNNPFEQEFGVEHLFFVLFLFLVPIVMFNLLNGVAVSDIQGIRQDAELVNTVSRVNLIAHIEEIISDLLSVLNKLDYFTTLVRRRSDSEATKCCDLLRQRFLLYINLFSTISDDGRIYISPHQDNRLLTKRRKLKGKPSVKSAITLPKLYISSAVVEAIQEKLDEKAANQSNYFGDTGVSQPNTLLAFKDQLVTIKNGLGKAEDRLEIIEEKLTEILDILRREKL